MSQLDALLTDEGVEQIAGLAETAGRAIMEIYEGADFDTRYKEDESPLTAADLAAHHILVDGLEALDPQLPVLSEESSKAAHAERRQWETFWMVDPLDGTKEFIKRNGEFTVNVALIHQGRPVLGVVHAPALEVTYWAVEGLGAFKQTPADVTPIAVADQLREPITVVVSRSHLRERDEAFIAELRQRFDDVSLSPTGSALKLCLVAEGLADVYPRFGPTMEWDIAAAHCVLAQAGGVLETDDGGPLMYNKAELVNPFFVARTPALPLAHD